MKLDLKLIVTVGLIVAGWLVSLGVFLQQGRALAVQVASIMETLAPMMRTLTSVETRLDVVMDSHRHEIDDLQERVRELERTRR